MVRLYCYVYCPLLCIIVIVVITVVVIVVIIVIITFPCREQEVSFATLRDVTQLPENLAL